MKQNIGFFYLKTGAGHFSGAKILSGKISACYGDEVDCKMFDLFNDGLPFCKFFFELGYSISSNYFEPGYITFYRLANHKGSIDLFNKLAGPFFIPKIIRFLKKNNIQKIVCVHQILVPYIREAINRVNPDIPLITIVMDPFSAHYTWFHEKNTELIVFSKKIKNEAINLHNFNADRVHQFPLMISEKFQQEYSEDEKLKIKKKYNIPTDKRIVLIAGGGEGLKKAEQIVKQFIKAKSNLFLIVVCGKNKVLKLNLENIKKKSKSENIRIFGFVDFMPDLMNIADCIVTKGGPATLMEALSVNKPIIMSSYIRGQELGNMFFTVQNEVGWYITKPKDIVEKIDDVLNDDAKLKEIRDRIKNMNIKNGLPDIAKFVYEF